MEFYAQKSSFSDQYYMNISIYPSDKKDYLCYHCYHARITRQARDLFDWQLLSEEDLRDILSGAVQNTLLPIIHASLDKLGQNPDIWKHCVCKRTACEKCWVAQNLWEANEATASQL